MYISCEFGVDRPRVSEIWITQYFPIDLNVKKNSTPPPQGPPNYLVPVPGVCSTLSQNFTPIAPSCVVISSTVQKSKLNITPNATLYGDIITTTRDKFRCVNVIIRFVRTEISSLAMLRYLLSAGRCANHVTSYPQ